MQSSWNGRGLHGWHDCSGVGGAAVTAFAYTYLGYRHWDALTYGHVLGISLGTAAVLDGLAFAHFLRSATLIDA